MAPAPVDALASDLSCGALVRPPRAPNTLARLLGPQDLEACRPVVARNSGSSRRLDAGSLGAEARRTASHGETLIAMREGGLGPGGITRGRLRPELGLDTTHVVLRSRVCADRGGAGPSNR